MGFGDTIGIGRHRVARSTAAASRVRWRALGLLAVTAIACGGSSREGASGPEPSASPTVITQPSATAVPGPTPSPPPGPVGAGELDGSFGDGGLAIVPIGGMVGGARRGLFVRADGRTSLLAFAGDDGGLTSELLHIDLPVDGGIAGAEPTIRRPIPDVRAIVAAFAMDGSALAVGRHADVVDGMVVARLTPSGELDLAYGDAGFATTDLDFASDVLPLDDGRALLIGSRDDRAVVTRLTRDGAVDRGFGRDGIAALPAAPEPDDGGRYELHDLVALPDGRVIVAATYHVAIASLQRLFGFTADGQLDAAFGDAGIVAPSILWPTSRLAIGRDGVLRWVIDDQLLLVGPDGELRGTSTIGETTYGSGFGALSETDTGGLVLAGSSWVPDEPRRFACQNTSAGTCLRLAVALQSLAADGGPDVAFGESGIVVTDLPAPYGAQDTGAQAVSLAPDRRVTVAASACRRPFDCDLVVLRYGAP